MAKPARVVVRNQKGRHAQGGAESADMVLVAGRRGTGKALYTCNYWPWSPKSVDAAEHHIWAAAERMGYEIIPSHE